MNKLDSAFDIDPLFHKMSKTFDEGGAKGLLLVNLGLGPQCNIVFDSSSEDAVADIASNSTGDDADREAIDMVQLASKFLAPEDDLFGMPLVPQLENLRAQLEGLVQEGFTDDGGAMDAPMTARKSRNSTSSALGRYAANDSDEQQADVSIHQEAVSRSLRLSSERELSVMMDEDETSSVSNSRNLSPSQPEPLSFSPMQEYAPDDFGGGNDDYDDYDGGGMPFDDSPVTMGARFSMLSQNGQRDASAFVPPSSTQATSELLDRIASSSHVLANSDYEFINSQMMIDNAWAGAAFWKRKAQRNQRPKKPAENDKSQKTPAKKKATKKKKKKVTSGLVFDEPPDLADILVKPKRQLLQWSRAVINKHSKEENLLPLDTGMGVEQLTQLFLRPDMAMYGAARPGPSQNVGFHPSTDSWYENDGGSFGGGDENDGPGFDFGGDDDNENHVTFAEDDAGTCLPELKGVRKVEKVSVGYATVAKKVDVKRLKKELWLELESHFGRDEDSSAEDDDEDRLMDSSQRTSFQAVVRNMESCKSQADVSLPFYFICILHLANEKGLRFESTGLGDFEIYPDVEVTGPSF
jgi:condensin complex subunit 2